MVDGTDQNLLGNDFRGSLFGQATSLPVGLDHHYSLWSSTIGLQVLATTHMDISIGLALFIYQSHLYLLAIIVSALFNFTGIYTLEPDKHHRTLDLLKNWVRTARH